MLSRRLFRLMIAQRWEEAKSLAKLLAVIHPFDGWPDMPKLFGALSRFSEGHQDSSLEELRELASSGGGLAEAALLQHFALQGLWVELVDSLKGRLREPGAQGMFLIPYYIRALGEIGYYPQMIAEFDRLGPYLVGRRDFYHYFLSAMILFSFCGESEFVREIFSVVLKSLPEDSRRFWVATAELSSGNQVGAMEEFVELFQSELMTVRVGAEQRNQARLPLFTGEISDGDSERLAHIRKRVEKLLAVSKEVRSNPSRPVVCWVIIASSVIGYLVQLSQNATENLYALHALGALFPPDVYLRGEYSRLVAPLFLHANATHLFTNMIGLLILGPFVERQLGRFPFLILYFGSGAFSLLAVVLLSYHGVLSPRLLIGASGAVMGLVGGTVAIFLSLWRRFRHGETIQQAKSAALIVVLQLIFDISTPQVSLTAHLSGAFGGLILGLVLLLFLSRSKRAG
jgi:rhomboid protease GluP